ncbi:MAG: hypothetical protein LQ351_003733 [Letrouitia transgressa]|nr:MAG: hypothetical protein LQ351_003733 [Letrouitia transgressa]
MFRDLYADPSSGSHSFHLSDQSRSSVYFQNEQNSDFYPITDINTVMEAFNHSRNEVERPRGQFFVTQQGYTYWRGSMFEPWMNAVFHNNIRYILIVNAAREGSYSCQRSAGSAADDVTAFLRTQDWGTNRFEWPPKVFQSLRNRSTEPTYHVPIWIWQGSVILDHEMIPLLDFKDLPATISSHEDGCILEGMIREDPRISDRDIAVRMPWVYTYPKLEPVVGPDAVALRRASFRNSAGCASWQEPQPVVALGSPFVTPEADPLSEQDSSSSMYSSTIFSSTDSQSGEASADRLSAEPLGTNPDSQSGEASVERASAQPLGTNPDSHSREASAERPLAQPLGPNPASHSGKASAERHSAQPFGSNPYGYLGGASAERHSAQPFGSNPYGYSGGASAERHSAQQYGANSYGYSGGPSGEWLLTQPVYPNPSLVVRRVGSSVLASRQWVRAQPLEPNLMRTTESSGHERQEDNTQRDTDSGAFLNRDTDLHGPRGSD